MSRIQSEQSSCGRWLSSSIFAGLGFESRCIVWNWQLVLRPPMIVVAFALQLKHLSTQEPRPSGDIQDLMNGYLYLMLSLALCGPPDINQRNKVMQRIYITSVGCLLNQFIYFFIRRVITQNSQGVTKVTRGNGSSVTFVEYWENLSVIWKWIGHNDNGLLLKWSADSELQASHCVFVWHFRHKALVQEGLQIVNEINVVAHRKRPNQRSECRDRDKSKNFESLLIMRLIEHLQYQNH